MFDRLTPRWSLFMMGCIALLLAPVPYIAFFKGPWIRERSPYSKILMAEEKKRVELEAGLKDMEKNDVEIQRQVDNEAELGSQAMNDVEGGRRGSRDEEKEMEGEKKARRESTGVRDREPGLGGRRQESWTSTSTSSTLQEQVPRR